MDTIKMSPEPSSSKTLDCEINEPMINEGNISKGGIGTINKTITTGTRNINNGEEQTDRETNSSSNIITTMASDSSNLLLKAPPVSVSIGREKRNVPSPSALLNLQESFADPQSPSSSSTTSQSTSANDATFEPTIEMMVNDFDDEQTLNEEEALAALESQDPDEEINTLKEESEMPLEELLAKYRAIPPPTPPACHEVPSRKKSKKSSSHKKKHKTKQNLELHATPTITENVEEFSHSKDIIITGNDEKSLVADDKLEDYDDDLVNSTLSPHQTPTLAHSNNDNHKDADKCTAENDTVHGEILKVRRSHLLDLYPEGTFDNVVVVNDAIAGNGKDIPLETLFGVEDEDEDEEIEEEEDEDYKKKVMIGTSYQATIPVGLSQYGDILPYENEDKLIWEPSQVSEREVEEYLIQIRDIKSNQQSEDDDGTGEPNEENLSKENGKTENHSEDLENNSLLANGDKAHIQNIVASDIDSQAVVKDNEQALHLLVQCGYDFKEALRRKRLNALPLNDCMSLWSEEECQKFEEGIQKYGKDFLKIRQNQVRTRTMRELVQFYYLWKKSERRDHNFANADTVDHMDIYLNEDNEYGSNPASVLTPLGSPVGTTSASSGTRRNSNTSQKNISIMTTTTTTTTSSVGTHNNSSNPTVTNSTLEKNSSTISGQQHQQQQHKRRTHSNSHTTNDCNSEIPATILTNLSK